MFGVPVHFATVFMTMCVSALALTSLDAVARIGRMSFQELFSVDDMEHAEGWRKLLCNTYFSTIVTLVCACNSYTLRILKGYRTKQQNAFPSSYHHALCNIYSTCTENNCNG